MNKYGKLTEDEVWNDLYPRIYLLIKKDQWEWESVGAVFGLGGGSFSIVVGMILEIATWSLFTQSVDPYLKKPALFALCCICRCFGSEHTVLIY